MTKPHSELVQKHWEETTIHRHTFFLLLTLQIITDDSNQILAPDLILLQVVKSQLEVTNYIWTVMWKRGQNEQRDDIWCLPTNIEAHFSFFPLFPSAH